MYKHIFHIKNITIRNFGNVHYNLIIKKTLSLEIKIKNFNFDIFHSIMIKCQIRRNRKLSYTYNNKSNEQNNKEFLTHARK